MRFHPLLLLIVLVTVMLGVVHTMPEAWLAVFDPLMLVIVIIAYLLAVIVMAARTNLQLWSFLGAGMLATFTADSMLFVRILAPRVSVDFPVGDVVAPTIMSDLWLEIVRALLVVGGPFIILGLLREWRTHEGERRYSLEPTNGNGTGGTP